MEKQIFISATFRHHDLLETNSADGSLCTRYDLMTKVLDTLFMSLPADSLDSFVVVGDVVTYSRIVSDAQQQAEITSRVTDLALNSEDLELLDLRSISREYVDDQYRKFLLENEKQKETPSQGAND